MTSIVIADDQILIAKALASIMENFRNYQVLYEVENGKALIEKFRQPRNIPDIVLLDINMPVMNGYETAKWLRANHPDILILTLSVQDDEHSLIKMVMNGANGYLQKNAHPTELEKALNTIASGGFYLPQGTSAKHIIDAISKGSTVQFSEKELEFFQHAATELSYKEIGEKMLRGTRSVESIRDALFEQIGVKTRIGLVMYGIKNGIIKL